MIDFILYRNYEQNVTSKLIKFIFLNQIALNMVLLEVKKELKDFRRNPKPREQDINLCSCSDDWAVRIMNRPNVEPILLLVNTQYLI